MYTIKQYYNFLGLICFNFFFFFSDFSSKFFWGFFLIFFFNFLLESRTNIYIYIYICRVLIWGVSFTVDVSEPKPNRPNTMNLVEKGAQELGLCEDLVNGRTGSLGSRIDNSVGEG